MLSPRPLFVETGDAGPLDEAGRLTNPTTREFVVDTPALTPGDPYRYQIVAVNGTNRVKVIT